MCLRGSSEVERTVLSRIHSNDLTAFIVWVPQLRGTQAAARRASALIDDPRTRHYWDGADVAGFAFADVLETPGPAWDVYLAYPRGVRWNSKLPPKPAYWMQQLGMPNVPHLDGPTFAQHVSALLPSPVKG